MLINGNEPAVRCAFADLAESNVIELISTCAGAAFAHCQSPVFVGRQILDEQKSSFGQVGAKTIRFEAERPWLSDARDGPARGRGVGKTIRAADQTRIDIGEDEPGTFRKPGDPTKRAVDSLGRKVICDALPNDQGPLVGNEACAQQSLAEFLALKICGDETHPLKRHSRRLDDRPLPRGGGGMVDLEHWHVCEAGQAPCARIKSGAEDDNLLRTDSDSIGRPVVDQASSPNR